MFRDKSIVTSIMFHTVGLENHPWVWSHISESLKSFEEKLQALNRFKYHSVFWSELYDYMNGDKKLPDNSIFLTFDDGYLDNWVYVYPLLKKYKLKGTIFVNPEFVDPGDSLRLTLEDVWAGKCGMNELQVPGFLNWSEMKAMEASGYVDIQSHSLTHTWHYKSPKLVDYHHYTNEPYRYPWLFWNAKPERKPFYLNENQNDFVEQGMPILEHEKSLVVKRFYPNENAMNNVKTYIENQNIDEFYKKDCWLSDVQSYVLEKYGKDGIPGYYETAEARLERIYHELLDSKQRLEKGLNKDVDFICWPGGGNDKEVHEQAVKAGYKSWTLGSQDQSNYRNMSNTNPQYIKRIGSSNKIYFRGNFVGEGSWFYMMLNIWAHQNSKFYFNVLRTYKLIRWVLRLK